MIKVTRTFNFEANDREINELLRLARSVWRRDTLLKAGKSEMRIFHARTLLLNPAINEARTCEAFRKAIHEAVEMLRRDAKDAIEADHAEALEMNEAIDKAIQYLLSINPQTNAQWSDGAFDGTFNASGKDWHIYAVMIAITLTKRAQMEARLVEALIMNSEYQTRTGQGVSHNTKAHSAPLSLLGNGLLEGGVRSHVVPS